MVPASHSASVYTDFQGLAELRAAASQQTPEAMRETARQFEAIFVQTMLKAMRAASPGDGLFDSDQTDFYRDIHDQQLALEIVKGQGLGIADMLMQSMGGAEPAADVPLQQDMRRTFTPLIPQSDEQDKLAPLIDVTANTPPIIAVPALPDTQEQPATRAPVSADWRPVDPETFIHDLMPVARKGAALLGVQPGVLVAQAALETGWGRKMIRHADGSSSFNLFGIKADSRWQGDRATVVTLEYEGGVASKQRASFRAYGSLEEAMTDYVDFLRTNPRYQQVIEQAGDSDAFLRGLKDAGYATDPYYAEKIRSIMAGKSFGQGMEQLALSGQQTDVTTTELW